MSNTATVGSFIVKARVKTLAKTHDKILGSCFLALLESEVKAMVEQAIHACGSRKIVRAKQYEEYRAILRGIAPKKADA